MLIVMAHCQKLHTQCNNYTRLLLQILMAVGYATIITVLTLLKEDQNHYCSNVQVSVRLGQKTEASEKQRTEINQ